MKRGGSHTLGRTLANNTSGLAAIRFGFKRDALMVFVSAGERRTSYSVAANGRRRALERATEFRTDAGLPAPSISTAMRRLREFAG